MSPLNQVERAKHTIVLASASDIASIKSAEGIELQISLQVQCSKAGNLLHAEECIQRDLLYTSILQNI